MRIGLLLALLAIAGTANADYKSDYREGIAAAERQEWDKVDALMRRALAQEPEPQGRVRLYGQVFVPYAPQFYLGLSAFSRNDCDGALRLLEDARSVSAIRGQRLEERTQIMVRACRARLAKATAGSPAVSASPAAPPTTSTKAPQPAATVATPPRPTPPVASRPSTPSTAPTATPPAKASEREPSVALTEARASLDASLRDGSAQWTRAVDPKSPEAAALNQALTRGRASLNATDAGVLLAAARTIDSAARALDAAQARSALANQVRARLQPLADAYLSGDFVRAAGWTDEQALQAVPQAHAQALLLRAAARYELYVLGGEADLDQFERVRADVRAARQLFASLNPGEKAFSPRFRSLFASTR